MVSFYQRNSFVIHSKVFLLLNPVEIFSPILFFYILTYGLFHQWRRKEAQSRTIFVFHVIRGMKLCARGGMGGERVEGEGERGEGKRGGGEGRVEGRGGGEGRGEGGGGRGEGGGGRVEGVRGKRGGRGRRSKFISPQTCTILYDCEFPVLNIILTFPFDQLTLRDYQQPLFLCESFAVSGNLIGAEQIPTDRGTVG